MKDCEIEGGKSSDQEPTLYLDWLRELEKINWTNQMNSSIIIFRMFHMFMVSMKKKIELSTEEGDKGYKNE